MSKTTLTINITDNDPNVGFTLQKDGTPADWSDFDYDHQVHILNSTAQVYKLLHKFLKNETN